MSAGRPWPAVVADVVKTDVLVVPARTTVAGAVRLLEGGHVSGAPVLEGEHVVGVITLRDLHRWLAATDPEELDAVAASRWDGPGSLDGVRVGDLLARRPVTARPEWPLEQAAALLAATGFQRLPVVDGAGRLVGVVARDVLAALAERPRRQAP